MIKVGMISLGCAKNLVDSEIMLGHLRQASMQLTSNPEEADVLIVNTCAFIDSAKEESISAILDSHRKKGMTRREGQKLIVAGCMSQRFSKELTHEIPEVDAFIGLDQVTEIAPIVQRLMDGDIPGEPQNLVTPRSTYIPDYDTPRFRLTPDHYAYIKIAEGCNHPCSFCVIPQMRGRHRSRTISSIVKEAKQLLSEGVRELLLISQDTTYYGMDLWEEKANPRQPVDPSRGETLVQLLAELDQLEGDFWIRLLYTHPAHWSDDLIQAIARSKKVARYIDMPLQHIHDDMLLAMHRETSSQHIIDLIARLRSGIPGLALRTTFITGFPGETEEHFEHLLEFIRTTKFERLGVFQYSQEEGSRAAKMENQVPLPVRKKRWTKAMKLQQKLSLAHNKSLLGKPVRILTEGDDQARTEADAPGIDGSFILKKAHPAGQFLELVPTSCDAYDLFE